MHRTFLLLFLFFQAFGAFAQIDSLSFQHHIIASPLPGPPVWGTSGFTLADYDRDGDLDITLSRRADSARVYWYEYRAGDWILHFLGTADDRQLGAATADINRDGFPDLVMGRFWFENPGMLNKNPDASFLRHEYSAPQGTEIHDIISVDMNNDGQQDILIYCQNEKNGILGWYEIPDLEKGSYQEIARDINSVSAQPQNSKGIHGGFSPMGAGDLNKDGYADIIMPHGWYKNPGKRKDNPWQLKSWPFPFGKYPNPYGLSIRSWICDLDSDGDNDAVITECDMENSDGYWIENKRNGKHFILHPLPSPGSPTGSFHSLAVADFDGDGDLDIFSGEQEDPDPGMKPQGLKERGFIWENTGDVKSPSFTVRVIQRDNPGWHDAIAGDVDGDGDMDIVSKVWNKDGEHYHADYWENQLKE